MRVVGGGITEFPPASRAGCPTKSGHRHAIVCDESLTPCERWRRKKKTTGQWLRLLDNY